MPASVSKQCGAPAADNAYHTSLDQFTRTYSKHVKSDRTRYLPARAYSPQLHRHCTLRRARAPYRAGEPHIPPRYCRTAAPDYRLRPVRSRYDARPEHCRPSRRRDRCGAHTGNDHALGAHDLHCSRRTTGSLAAGRYAWHTELSPSLRYCATKGVGIAPRLCRHLDNERNRHNPTPVSPP
jgi:hypothetical protein